MMKKPESQVPSQRQDRDAASVPRGFRRFSPKRKAPRKRDSRKNEKTPSMARVWPMTPPAAAEKRAQLVPNWNSMGMPVTTPMAKLIAKMRAQKRAAAVVVGAPGAQGEGLQHHDEKREPHRELGEEVVVVDREGEGEAVQPQRGLRGSHRAPVYRSPRRDP